MINLSFLEVENLFKQNNFIDYNLQIMLTSHIYMNSYIKQIRYTDIFKLIK